MLIGNGVLAGTINRPAEGGMAAIPLIRKEER